MNRINHLFQTRPGQILSVYFTAGYPTCQSTAGIIRALTRSGVDMIEIGMPFSDPLADGPVIQHSSDAALRQGMSLKLLFSQLQGIRDDVVTPLLLMGYLNPVMQFGMENFCRKCKETGIDGVILPDLPLQVYEEEYRDILEDHGLHSIFLVSPQTSPGRVEEIDNASQGFIYMVSSSSTTGVRGAFSGEQISYFERIRDMKLKNPGLIGFGISGREGFESACRYASGAIIGSAFVEMLGRNPDPEDGIRKFIGEIRGTT